MVKYQRFVAYVYEYQKGKKGNNCGFIKVEAREQVCLMEVHMRCPGLIAGMECTVYGFVRRKGLLEGSRIGKFRTEAGRMDCLLETQTMAVGHGKIPLGDMNGMILILDSGGFFGTEWDDRPIRPEDFQEMTEETEQKTEPAKEDEQVHTQSVQESEMTECPEPLKPQKYPPHKLEPGCPEPAPVGVPCEAFGDGEMTECRRITIDELCRLGRRVCMLRNNRFLQYGYHNFGHLLLCCTRDGQWMLGVPGAYDQQEGFMANMFGFSYFKESRDIQVPKGKGGYWYRSVDAPNFNS